MSDLSESVKESVHLTNDNVTTVVVNWNSGSHLHQCLKSLRGCSRAIVVDNGSSDGSTDLVHDFENTTLISAGENLGFGKACNLGAEHANTEYLLFLNPDARLLPGAVDRVVTQMESERYAEIGITGVQLLDDTGEVARSCAQFPTPLKLFAQCIGLDKLFPQLSHFMLDWPHDRTREVDQVIGAFFLVRRELFVQLGGFDERFFVYFEEVDFAYRARQAGWKTLYLADVHAFHAGGGTSEQIKATRLFYVLRSRLLYARKHFNRLEFLMVVFATLFLEPLSRSALAIGRRSWSVFKETWQAYGKLWCWLSKWAFHGETR